ncbi:hypothetical protein [Nocardioides marmoraquaticus]
MSSLDVLADWSPWVAYADARAHAPREPGVFLLREPTGEVRYVGTAGERAGAGRPQGLRGRLTVYWTGRGPVSGLGEAALDRALADPGFVEQQLALLRDGDARTARHWAQSAVLHLGLEVSWAVTPERDDASYLEKQVVALLRPQGTLW